LRVFDLCGFSWGVAEAQRGGRQTTHERHDSDEVFPFGREEPFGFFLGGAKEQKRKKEGRKREENKRKKNTLDVRGM
jgi:hypothetical protein